MHDYQAREFVNKQSNRSGFGIGAFAKYLDRLVKIPCTTTKRQLKKRIKRILLRRDEVYTYIYKKPTGGYGVITDLHLKKYGMEGQAWLVSLIYRKINDITAELVFGPGSQPPEFYGQGLQSLIKENPDG